MSEIKYYEPRYNGFRFRGRTEARWAVFFDTLGIKYEYEPEGFEIILDDGSKEFYLPDFYLPEAKAWVEVKGGGQISENEMKKIEAFAETMEDACSKETPMKRITNKVRILVGGIPKEAIKIGPHGGIPALSYEWKNPSYETSNGIHIQDVIELRKSLALKKHRFLPSLWVDLNFNYEDICSALTKARQARFEHGKKG